MSAGCGTTEKALDLKKGSASSGSESASVRESSIPTEASRPSGSATSGVGRRLDEAGSVKQEHPAAGMERPDKWKNESRPTFADLSKAGDYPAVEPQELGFLSEAGMSETRLFVVSSSPQDFLRSYQADAEAKIVEKGRTKSMTLPVKEGLMLVTASENSEGKTLVTELLLPRETRSVNLDFLESLRERADQRR